MKSTVFLVLLISGSLVVSASADEEYFQNSIFRALKDRNGQFRSQMKHVMFYRKSSLTTELDEKFSFKTNNGLLAEKTIGYSNIYQTLVLGGKEVHLFREDSRFCYSYRPHPSSSRWTPLKAIDADYEFKIYGKFTSRFLRIP